MNTPIIVQFTALMGGATASVLTKDLPAIMADTNNGKSIYHVPFSGYEVINLEAAIVAGDATTESYALALDELGKEGVKEWCPLRGL